MKRETITTWGPVLAAAFVAQAILTAGIVQGPVAGFNADDAMHALAGASVLHDIARVDLRSLVVDVWDQGRWPPLGSFLQLPTLAVLGISMSAHRFAILLLLLPALAVMAAAAKSMGDEEDAPWAASIVAGLALSSGVLLLASSSVLYEMPGMAIMIASYVAANEGWRTGKTKWFWAGSALLAAAWFTKWQYGIVATVALLVAGIVRKRRGEKSVPMAEVLYLVPIVTLAVWFVSAYHVREFGLYMLWKPASLGTAARYLHQYAGLAVHGGWVTRINVAVTLLGLALAAPMVPRSPLAVALATDLVFATVGSGGKDMSLRIGLWLAMPAWTLAAAGWARAIGRTGEWSRRLAWPAMAGALVVVIAAGTAVRQVHERHTERVWGGDWYEPEARYVAESVPLGAKLATVGGWCHYVTPFHLRWQLLRLHWGERFSQRRVKVVDAPSLDWMPWTIRWSSPAALLALRRDADRPERRIVPPDYVAVMRLREGMDPKEIAKLTGWLRQMSELELLSARDFPSGSRVEIYRCKVQSQPWGSAPPPAGAEGP